LLGVQFRSLGVVMNGVLIVAVSHVCMVRSLFVLLGLVVFCCLFVMIGCLFMVTGSAMVVLLGL
jgi:hypothetical protein